jgi:hypothetical protein
VLSATTSRKTDAQATKKILLIISENVTFVFIKATRMIIETIGGKFTKNKSLAAEKLNTIELL